MIRRAPIVIALLAVALAIAACGSDDGSESGEMRVGDTATAASKPSNVSGSGGGGSIQDFGEAASADERVAAANALEDYFGALVGGDPEAACGLLAPPVQEKLATIAPQGEDGCIGALAALLAGYPPKFKRNLKTARVTEVRVEGEQAFALYTQRGAQPSYIPMTRDSEAWKVAALGGAALL